MSVALEDVRAWVLDVDGCLMRTAQAGGVGGTPMPRAADLLNLLRGAGHTVVVCTNASTEPPAAYAAHLRSRSLDIPDDDLITAGSAAADYVAVHHPDKRVLAVGAEGLAQPLRRLGVPLADPADPDPADVVVVGSAAGYATAVLSAAALAVDAGAPLYTTVGVPWFHGGLGRSLTASGAIAAAIGWATGTTATVLGKPSPGLAEYLRRRLGARADQAAVVGDALVEVELARHMGARSALVLSGATTREQLHSLEPDRRPDDVLTDVAHLHDLLTARLQGVAP